jgi:phosphate-selective porin OprO/OprP
MSSCTVDHGGCGRHAFRLGVLAASVLIVASVASAQTANNTSQGQAITTRMEAAESDGDVPKRRLVNFNEYEGKHFSIRVGGGFLYDYVAFHQDEASKAQMSLSPAWDVRDFRFLAKGRLPIPRVTYTIGYMYDKGKDDWRFRQTGVMVEIRKAYGSFFIGRTKEGFSTNKIMVGYQGWTIERAPVNDAMIPILADGVKWSGTIPNGKFLYNFGFFKDTRTEDESFNKNDNQVVVRGVWLPNAGTDRPLVHIALEARHAKAEDGALQYRSKPEAYLAQSYAVDTGRFTAESANAYGVETYYRPGPLMFGMEYFFNTNKAPESGNPFLHGGEVFVAYIFTGELKPYNARGGYFERVSPARPVFDGGPGAWELVVRYSYTDFDSGPIRGGAFWRVTPMVNWHMSDHVRFEFVYGYSSLNRLNLTGKTQFFQTRLQLQL